MFTGAGTSDPIEFASLDKGNGFSRKNLTLPDSFASLTVKNIADKLVLFESLDLSSVPHKR